MRNSVVLNFERTRAITGDSNNLSYVHTYAANKRENIVKLINITQRYIY